MSSRRMSSRHHLGLLLSVLVGVVATAQLQFRGVDPKLKDGALYDLKRGFFACHDRSDVIDVMHFNDDYCDCADGSDEPGTSACAESQFFCVNKGHRGRTIHGSVVGDRICDCCDGSDEGSGVCPNTCKAEGEKDRAARLEEAETHEQGSLRRSEYIEKAAANREANRERKAQLQKELAAEETELAKMTALKDSPWTAEARDAYGGTKQHSSEEHAAGAGEAQQADVDAKKSKDPTEPPANANERHALPASSLNANERHALPAHSDPKEEEQQQQQQQEKATLPNANERHALPASQPTEESSTPPEEKPAEKAPPEVAAPLHVSDLRYDAPQRSISSHVDWDSVPRVSQSAFKQADGTVVLFEPHAGGTWSGPEDHAVSVAFAWNPEKLFLLVEVTDDSHQNSGSGWNGDAVQIAITDAKRSAVTHLYNVALTEEGKVVVEKEQGVDGVSADVRRHHEGAKTVYEIVFPAETIWVGEPGQLAAGKQIGVGICVNDGDAAEGQGGQKGWSGWGPHTIVHGKDPKEAGLVTLAASEEVRLPPANDMLPDEDTVQGDAASKAASEALLSGKRPLPGMTLSTLLWTCLQHPRWCFAKATGQEPDDPASVNEARKQQIESDHKRAQDKVDELKREIGRLEAEAQMDYGEEGEFQGLKGQCVELKQQQYVYKLCPFENMNQDNSDLGAWSRWEQGEGVERHSVMKYENGASCWQGPSRSTTVHVRCGKENALVDVHETERCVYEATFETPAKCSMAHAARLRQGVKDEL